MVHVRKLCAVGAGCPHLRLLRWQRSHVLFMQGGALRRKRTSCQTALPAVVTNARVVHRGYVIGVSVVNDRGIYA